jgi:hypothetical protein
MVLSITLAENVCSLQKEYEGMVSICLLAVDTALLCVFVQLHSKMEIKRKNKTALSIRDLSNKNLLFKYFIFCTND